MLTAEQLNTVTVAAKVSRVEGQQPAFPVGQHGGDDVGVVNLPPSHRNLPAQRQQPVGYHRTGDDVVGNMNDLC